MKKLVALLLTLSSVFMVVACTENRTNNQDSQSSNSIESGCLPIAPNEIQYISEFENYYDCNICQVANKGKHKINEDIQYVVNGERSLKIIAYEESYEGYIPANNYYSQVVDLSNAKYISMDVYNANEFSVYFTLSVVSDTGSTFLMVDKVCQPNAWTEVGGIFDGESLNKGGAMAAAYKFTANNDRGEAFEIYFDDLYVEFDKNAERTQMTKVFAESEIQNFETIGDTIAAELFSTSRIGVTRSLNTDSYYAKDGFSLCLNVKENVAPTFQEIWNLTQYLYFGLRFDQNYLKQTGLSSQTTAISMWVFNDNISRKKAYIKVFDTDGFSAEISTWCAPNTWTEVRLENFGQVKLDNINQMEVYFEGLHTFNEYSLFIDNLRFEEV